MLTRIKNFGVWMVWGTPKPQVVAAATISTHPHPTSLGAVAKASAQPEEASEEKPVEDASDDQPDTDVPTDDSPAPSDGEPTIRIDALALLQQDLQKKLVHLHAELLHWETTKEAILGKDFRGKKAASEDEVKPAPSPITKLVTFFKRTWESFMGTIRTGEDELDALIRQAHPHIDALKVHLVEQRNKLAALRQAPETTIDEIQQLQCDMFDTGIEIVIELKKLIDNVIVEINYCLQREKLGENVMKASGRFLLLIIDAVLKLDLRDMLPDIKIDFEEGYRVSLMNDITEEEESLIVFETDNEVELKRTLKQLSEDTFRKNPSNFFKGKPETPKEPSPTPEAPSTNLTAAH
jgi:hypothetical protein